MITERGSGETPIADIYPLDRRNTALAVEVAPSHRGVGAVAATRRLADHPGKFLLILHTSPGLHLENLSGGGAKLEF